MNETPWILPNIDLTLCDGCARCVETCPQGALAMDLNPLRPVYAHPLACTYCSDCEAACPQGAIRCEFEIRWDKP
jgi:NAD-dependent dihydropyrimidine dehydrogenase PreA subunit